MFVQELSTSILCMCDMLDISYEKASERCGISPRYFGSIARGQTAPTVNTLEKICVGFEKTPNDLLGFTTVDEELSYRIPMQVKNFRRQFFLYGTYTVYPVCPHCQCCIEREFQAFCDRCGQKLDWRAYQHATLLKKR